jgi:hypothetical protein
MLSYPLEKESYSERQVKILKNFLDVLRESYPNQPIGSQILPMKGLPDANEKAVRRLSFIADYEGKTRVIAISDLLSNSLLKPIHDKLMSSLKGNLSDMTHKQHLISSRVKSFYEKGLTPFSIDLTAATDRLPVGVTTEVISNFFDEPKLANA